MRVRQQRSSVALSGSDGTSEDMLESHRDSVQSVSVWFTTSEITTEKDLLSLLALLWYQVILDISQETEEDEEEREIEEWMKRKSIVK